MCSADPKGDRGVKLVSLFYFHGEFGEFWCTMVYESEKQTKVGMTKHLFWVGH